MLFTKLVVTKILYLRKESILCLNGLSAVPVATYYLYLDTAWLTKFYAEALTLTVIDTGSIYLCLPDSKRSFLGESSRLQKHAKLPSIDVVFENRVTCGPISRLHILYIGIDRV